MIIRTVENSHYRRMLRPQCFADWVSYLNFMIDFYFRAMVTLGPVGFKSEFRAQMSTTLQMMFTKGKDDGGGQDNVSHGLKGTE